MHRTGTWAGRQLDSVASHVPAMSGKSDGVMATVFENYYQVCSTSRVQISRLNKRPKEFSVK